MSNQSMRHQHHFIIICMLLIPALRSVASPGVATVPVSVQAPAHKAPEILIMVYLGLNGQDAVNLTYSGAVPHMQAQRDLKALETSSGILFNNTKIEDGKSPLRGSKLKMTSVTSVAPYIHGHDPHSFALEPIVVALRPYHRLTVMFCTEDNFEFHGLHDYADNHVRIALDQSPSVYTYQIEIRDPHFEKLNLPTYQPTAAEMKIVENLNEKKAAESKRRMPWMMALVTAAALVGGGVVYIVMARKA